MNTITRFLHSNIPYVIVQIIELSFGYTFMENVIQSLKRYFYEALKVRNQHGDFL